MRAVLIAGLSVIAVGAWLVGAWAGSRTFRGGPRKLYERPWLMRPLVFSALVKQANERDYYRIKNVAVLTFGLCIIAIVIVNLVFK